jgi:hypothetical protein
MEKVITEKPLDIENPMLGGDFNRPRVAIWIGPCSSVPGARRTASGGCDREEPGEENRS